MDHSEDIDEDGNIFEIDYLLNSHDEEDWNWFSNQKKNDMDSQHSWKIGNVTKTNNGN